MEKQLKLFGLGCSITVQPSQDGEKDKWDIRAFMGEGAKKETKWFCLNTPWSSVLDGVGEALSHLAIEAHRLTLKHTELIKAKPHLESDLKTLGFN